jgi:hypothetical protein
MNDIERLIKEIESLKLRNKKVEMYKAWETSILRKLILLTLTYLVAGITLHTIQNPNPWANALIPTLGFFLSTLSMPFLRKLWEKYIYKK